MLTVIVRMANQDVHIPDYQAEKVPIFRYDRQVMDSGTRTVSPGGSGDDSLCDLLRDWYQSPLGQSLEAIELAAVRNAMANLFGYHVLLVEPPWSGNPLDTSRIPHKIRLEDASRDVSDVQVAALSTALPIGTDSLDVVVLPHVLERSDDPHQLLREVDRCLIPEGHVIITGFNPWGVWGLRRLMTSWRGRVPWCLRFISHVRIEDWLALLGFDILEVRALFYRPPVQRAGVLERLSVLERFGDRGWPIPGACYQLLARKRVLTMTPVRPRWRPRRGILGASVAEPTRRSS